MVEPLGFEPKSYEFTLVLIAVETFLDPMELDVGFEPTTYRLQGDCSAN